MISQLTPLKSLDLTVLSPYKLNNARPVMDSRKVTPGDLFLACPGGSVDGRDYIAAALKQGAAFVLWDDADGFVWQDAWQVPNLAVSQLAEQAGRVAAYLMDHPSQKLNCIGITGTNGKTSISQWLAQALDLLGQRCAVMGTVGNGFWGELVEATHTTPDPVSIQAVIRDVVAAGAQALAMEVSSHGLAQGRVNGVAFKTAVFTNLTRDHLDYHGDMASYGAMKSRLFYWQGLQHAVINVDDDYGAQLAATLGQEAQNKAEVVTYGFLDEAIVKIASFEPSLDGMRIGFETPWGNGELNTALLGRFNAQNLAACVGVLCAQGHDLAQVLAVLAKIKPATGRMDCVKLPNKPLVVVDYAHTPDALEKALTTLHEVKAHDSELWCVFGCGGNRDKGKRPLMGAVAQQFADRAVVTSDNPRLEDPQSIIDDILPAVPHPALVEVDRARAIEQTIALARPNDIVLIAGKGHETYQDVGGQKHHFSDFEVALNALEQK
ncbi:MAG: UDP-N-acetylmuramoyl-L-alanyl-D-glutamate--2,6-diaminopimelate ligase [Neisseriaceae bacterium]|nr:UDP-N-acetylmuramoyl-L-alanyl-D-glutamate--2,6-diaminopimelate ligase [Neisseriaceae bacterium]